MHNGHNIKILIPKISSGLAVINLRRDKGFIFIDKRKMHSKYSESVGPKLKMGTSKESATVHLTVKNTYAK